MPVPLYPLKLTATCHQKMWGGRRLADYHDIPPEGSIGEVWLVSDHRGGSRVVNGPLAGLELGELVARFGSAINGALAAHGGNNAEVFPLILKLIHSNQALSIQVHPDDSYAVEHGIAPSGKTEAWLILESEPGASLGIGFESPVSREIVRDAIENGTLERLVGSYPVTPGESYLLPAGRIHSLGPGIVLAEIQQNGPVTYRLYDYRRIDSSTGRLRELDVARALEVLNYSRTDNPRTGRITTQSGAGMVSTFVACRYFCGQEMILADEFEDRTDGSTPVLIACLGGFCTIDSDARESASPVTIVTGESILIPAAPLNYRIRSCAEKSRLLRFFIPDLASLRNQFRHEGHSDRNINALAGFMEPNDFAGI